MTLIFSALPTLLQDFREQRFVHFSSNATGVVGTADRIHGTSYASLNTRQPSISPQRGYNASDNMRAENNIQALRMALSVRNINNYGGNLIHHSDRGAQYISDGYTELLTENGIKISMCNEVYENTHIERVNGIIKNDYLKYWNIPNLRTLIAMLEKAVVAYNYDRPHSSLPSKMPPIEYELALPNIKMKDRPLLEIYCSDRRSHQDTNQLTLQF